MSSMAAECGCHKCHQCRYVRYQEDSKVPGVFIAPGSTQLLGEQCPCPVVAATQPRTGQQLPQGNLSPHPAQLHPPSLQDHQQIHSFKVLQTPFALPGIPI